MIAAIPAPIGLAFEDWAAVVAEQYAPDYPGNPPTESAWRDWAGRLIQMDEFGGLPDPAGFGDWRLWAEEFLNVLWNRS